MESKQVLSIEQMQHLQELGLNLKPSLVHYYKVISEDNGKWYLSVTIGDILDGSPRYRYIPAYTLHDVLDALPEWIYVNIEQYLLEINFFYKYIRYSRLNDVLCKRNFDRTSLIDAAYELLCWAIENKFVETNKSK